ncbi:MAG: hypothetical protein CVV61_04975 [Tenericutes bacterium HGW-Tenericutes-6]|nr:MAG: hypothetical protein CVV61_04975 [Tenericutes bacterium HGW-Tenericutes-6]
MNKDNLIYRRLMHGISFMIPFVVTGGILMSISHLILGSSIDIFLNPNTTLSSWILDIGTLAFSFMLPILAGYISFAISDRPGLVPGFMAGAIAYTGGSGFIGAILGGFIAGYMTEILKKGFQFLPKSMQGLKPMLFFPLFGTILTALLMLPVTFLFEPTTMTLRAFLKNIEGIPLILLCILLASLMAIDMGGPINKAAYIIGLASMTSGESSKLMAAIMVGGMIPPLGIALTTTLFKNRFTKIELKQGKSNYLMGLSFITEGAMPFALKKPKVVIPSLMLGSALSGAIIGLFKTASPTPHGGIFVVPLMTNWYGFIIALISGVILSTLLLSFLLKETQREENVS